MSEVLFFDASDQLVEMASNNNSDLFLEHIPKICNSTSWPRKGYIGLQSSRALVSSLLH